MHFWPIVQALALVLAANGAPVLAKKIFGARGAWPLDFGALFVDGRPLFGPSKTIRGVAFAILAAAVAAPFLGAPWSVGALAGAAAMAGDLLSSFIKRRLNLQSQSMAFGLDQSPEALLPLLACKDALHLGAADVAAGTGLFLIGELILSRALYALNIRDRPY
jgi:hypothetical protein